MGRIDLTNQVFGDFKVIEYLGKKRYLIKCLICDEEKEIATNNLKKHIGVTCSLKNPKRTIKPGDTFGEWEVLEYSGDKKYLCKCSCGNIKNVHRNNLMNNSQTSCGHNRNSYGDLTGKQINEWTVLGKEGYLYKCRCSCGKIQLLGQGDLMSGKSKQCGHGYNIRTDIQGQTFGNWQVLEYLGHQVYLCQCSCENHTTKTIRKADLLNGHSTQCGCLKHTKAKETLLEKYGDTAPNRARNPRTEEQIKAVESKESLREFIIKHSNNGTIAQTELQVLLGLGLSRSNQYVYEYSLEELIRFNDRQSQDERDIIKWLRDDLGLVVIDRNRQILRGKEIDIYIPDKQIGIEYNGSFWHSDLLKDRKYHQEKSLEARKNGVRLIHIFEYEWKNPKIQAKLKNYLMDVLGVGCDKRVVYARNTSIRQISHVESSSFLDRYHLQGQANATIHIGIFSAEQHSEELLGVMTFGKPRFTCECEYELIRMCFKPGVSIPGGAQKMFKHFIRNYKPKSVLTYSDIAKFTGKVYETIGFKAVENGHITQPNYVWVKLSDYQFLKRYSTTKQSLIESGLGEESQTESEIMESMGYVKVHDCGQFKFKYTREVEE